MTINLAYSKFFSDPEFSFKKIANTDVWDITYSMVCFLIEPNLWIPILQILDCCFGKIFVIVIFPIANLHITKLPTNVIRLMFRIKFEIFFYYQFTDSEMKNIAYSKLFAIPNLVVPYFKSKFWNYRLL